MRYSRIHGGRGENDEVTFEDIITGTGKHKAGYRKLQFCNNQSKAHDLHYFWVDTCCIDKTNNSELTEAINSMFKWYQNAERCYVYLADVCLQTQDVQEERYRPWSLTRVLGLSRETEPVQSAHGSAQLRHVEWESAFRGNRWFTRGWTLQELLAPHHVEFYSSDGVRLGDKASLRTIIHEITGINLEALQGDDVTTFDTSDRLTWAEKRQATKPEDRVYCLLGICGVNMSLIYSEGYEKALRRLKREIGYLNSDEAGHSGKAPPFSLPLERNPRFTGRELELSLLEEALTSKGDFTARASLVGMGGVGKTQLAIEMAHRLARKEHECSVFWVFVTDLESMLHAYRAIADHLNLPDDLSMWIEGPAMQQSAIKVIDCLPKSSQGRILFTTRDRRVAVKLSQQDIVKVNKMESHVAAELLRPKPDTTAENAGLRACNEADVQTLVTRLEALPLAIVQAAAYIDANQISITDYLSLFAEQEETMIELLSEDQRWQ